MKDNPTSILANTNDNDFFPAVESPLCRFCLYAVVWVGGIALMILPAAAIVALISK